MSFSRKRLSVGPSQKQASFFISWLTDRPLLNARIGPVELAAGPVHFSEDVVSEEIKITQTHKSEFFKCCSRIVVVVYSDLSTCTFQNRPLIHGNMLHYEPVVGPH